MNYNIYRISRDKWNKVVNNHSRPHHNPPSGNQIYKGRKGKKERFWSEKKSIRNKHIFTSIQCVVSRGFTLGNGGGLTVYRLNTVKDFQSHFV